MYAYLKFDEYSIAVVQQLEIGGGRRGRKGIPEFELHVEQKRGKV